MRQQLLCIRCNKHEVPHLGGICAMCTGSPVVYHEVKEPPLDVEKLKRDLEQMELEFTPSPDQLKQVIHELRAALWQSYSALHKIDEPNNEQQEALDEARRVWKETKAYE